MTDVVMPALNSTDESYVLLEWLVPDGGQVSAGDPLALVETSKTVTELIAANSGYLSHLVSASSACRPGDAVGLLSEDHAREPGGQLRDESRAADAAPPANERLTLAAAGSGTGIAVVVTEPARILMDAHGISADAVAGLGKKLIRRSDVEALVAGSRPGRKPGRGPQSLPAHQQAVARLVSKSHATIPPAFTVIKVTADELIRRRELFSKQMAAFTGIPEYVIKAVADTSPDFPVCFASIADDLAVTLADSIDIGVTIDVGTGLYVPVIRAADTLDLTAIASQMMNYRARAMRSQMREHDFAGARLTISLHQFNGIVFAQPIVYPGQVCALSVAAPDQEIRLAPSGQIVEHTYFFLGMSYDHRVINGRTAADFLAAIRARLEEPANPPQD